MARKVFFSFHYKPDNWRVATVRNIGVIEGNKPATDNGWESITSNGDSAIKRWIAEQMHGRSCTVLLVGSGTANRKWINHEIVKTWEDGKGILGINIHNIKNSNGLQSAKGTNPFKRFEVGGKSMDKIVKVYDPPYSLSKNVYDYIRDNIETWIDTAIDIRKRH